MKVIFSNRAYAALLTEVYEKISTETGGVFLGYVEDENWYIVETMDPGPNSIFQVAYFEYDQKYVTHLINKTARLYKKKLALIGLWHRHPGSFDIFSGTDDGTNAEYASMRPEGAISCLVNIDPLFRLTVYHVTYPHRYSKIQYEVGDDFFPEGVLELNNHDKLVERINGYERGLRNKHLSENKSKVSLGDLIKKVESHLNVFGDRVLNSDIESFQNDEKWIEVLSDEALDDLDYCINELNMKLEVKTSNGVMNIACAGKTFHLTYVNRVNKFILFTDSKQFCYESGIIKKSYEAKEKPYYTFFTSFLKF